METDCIWSATKGKNGEWKRKKYLENSSWRVGGWRVGGTPYKRSPRPEKDIQSLQRLNLLRDATQGQFCIFLTSFKKLLVPSPLRFENLVAIFFEGLCQICVYVYCDKHCQRHNGPEGWVHLSKVTSWSHIKCSYTNPAQISSSESCLTKNEL